jgi:pheromone a factor receptor
MALASTDLLLTVPLATFVLHSNVAITGLNPSIYWADTDSNFSRVVQVPGIYWRADPYSAASVETLRWATAVACALLFFGFANEAIKNCRAAFQSVARRVDIRRWARRRGSVRLSVFASSLIPFLY